MYADPDCTVPYFGTEEIDSGSTVYCKLICSDGFFCSRFIFNSGAADSETFVMPEGELDLSASIFRRQLTHTTPRSDSDKGSARKSRRKYRRGRREDLRVFRGDCYRDNLLQLL